MEINGKPLAAGVGTAAGLIASLWDSIGLTAQALLVLMVLDYIGGVLAAMRNGRARSDIGKAGVVRKAGILLIILGIWALQRSATVPLPAVDVIAGMFAGMEFLSLVEKGALLGVRYPRPFTQGLEKVRKWVAPESPAEERGG